MPKVHVLITKHHVRENINVVAVVVVVVVERK